MRCARVSWKYNFAVKIIMQEGHHECHDKGPLTQLDSPCHIGRELCPMLGDDRRIWAGPGGPGPQEGEPSAKC